MLTAVAIQNDRIQLAAGGLGPGLIWPVPSSHYLPNTYGEFYVLSYFCGANQQTNSFMNKPIKSALISVFYKDGLNPSSQKLHQLGVTIYSTGGTQQFIEKQGVPCVPVETLTSYPSILGGRVKTLHPLVFGGILGRRDNSADMRRWPSIISRRSTW